MTASPWRTMCLRFCDTGLRVAALEHQKVADLPLFLANGGPAALLAEQRKFIEQATLMRQMLDEIIAVTTQSVVPPEVPAVPTEKSAGHISEDWRSGA